MDDKEKSSLGSTRSNDITTIYSNIEERKDDDEKVIKIRISKYIEETRPLLDFYKTTYPQMYRTINGNQEIEKIYLDIVKIVKK